MRRLRLILILAVGILLLIPAGAVLAATTADVTVYATPSFISIANSPSTFDFEGVAEGVDESTTTGYFTVTNTSSVATNVTIAVTSENWTGGVGWIHSDIPTAGPDQAGLKASENTGAFDVIVKYISPVNIVSSQAANTDFYWELQLIAPTSFGDGVQKQIIVRLTATPP